MGETADAAATNEGQDLPEGTRVYGVPHPRLRIEQLGERAPALGLHHDVDGRGRGRRRGNAAQQDGHQHEAVEPGQPQAHEHQPECYAPAACPMRLAGEQEERRISFGGLIDLIPVALLVIYALLAIPLRSYFQPLVIMSVIPFGVVGAVIGHLVMGWPMILTLGG